MKITNDAYYTPIALANYCWDKVEEIIGFENISEIIEPSCGNGAFYNHNIYIPHFGYDINPKFNHTNIIKGDFLQQDIKYLYGRLIIGNPPYGNKMYLSQQFYRKSVEIADYIAFILPISQLNNLHSLYQFDLIYSEDLGKKIYTDRELHCCFNIYKRPVDGELNKRPNNKLKDVSIYRQDSKEYMNKDFDIRMCYWGDGTAGKILQSSEHYSAEYKIKIHNDKYKDKIIEILNNFNWEEYLQCIAMRKIQQFHIIKVLKEQIPELE